MKEEGTEDNELALWIPSIDMEKGPAERGSIQVTLWLQEDLGKRWCRVCMLK